MEENKKNFRSNSDCLVCDVKERVLEVIRKEKIRIRSPFIFAAQKLGLESALAATLVLGAFIVASILYFLKKTETIKFLSLGIPGIKSFLLALPYDYLALFAANIILAIYLSNKIEIFCGDCEKTDKFAVYFFVISVVLGIFFVIMGVEDFLAG